MSYVQTVFPGYVPADYFSDRNINFIRDKIRSLLREEFDVAPEFYREDVVRVMQRVMEARLESIPRMNQRVIMELTRDFRNHQIDVRKKMNWSENFWNSQVLFDETTDNFKFDGGKIKLSNRLGRPRVGGSLRFHFT